KHVQMKWTAIAALACAVAMTGCASERDPINHVQPNAIRKDLMQGERNFQQTVVDIPGTNSATFIGKQRETGMERLTFDMQDNWLNARRSYQMIQKADGGVVDGKDADSRPYLGAIVASCPITSHFDLKRAHNPTTGEEYNVLEENDKDRPWYEREYMR